MFATVNYYSGFRLLLLLALSLLDHAYAQRNIGDRCFTSQGPGACQLVYKCTSVYNDMKSGKWPETTCGFQGSTPIVCCPPEDASPFPIATSQTGPVWGVVRPKVTKRPVNPPADVVRISRRMCAEYEKSFFGQVALGINRINDGTKAHPMEFTHMAAVGYNNNNKDSTISWDCGGTLISDRFVLTAAHCITSFSRGDAQWVRLGFLGSSRGDAETQFLQIIERIRHPKFQRPARYNDIALLKLQRSVTFNAYVKPACLDTKENHSAGKMTVATGWGLTNHRDINSRSANLLKVELPIVAHSNCASIYSKDRTGSPHGIDEQSQICAGGNGKGTCQGDSGGPLIMKSLNAPSLPVVVGITSFGQLCGTFSPEVYTRVSFYVPWIESIVWPDKLV